MTEGGSGGSTTTSRVGGSSQSKGADHLVERELVDGLEAVERRVPGRRQDLRGRGACRVERRRDLHARGSFRGERRRGVTDRGQCGVACRAFSCGFLAFPREEIAGSLPAIEELGFGS